MSLRTRLVAGLLVLMAVASIGLDIATSTALKSFLLSRADQQLVSTVSSAKTLQVVRGLTLLPPGSASAATCGPVASSYYYGLYDQSGYLQNGCSIPGDAAPLVSSGRIKGVLNSFLNGGDGSSQPFTVGSQGSSLQYRVVVAALNDGSGAVVVGEPLSDITSTLNHLRFVEIIATAGVLLLMTGLGIWLVRRGLRPLDEMAATAGAIAEGDLSQRVRSADPRTEVGRLGIAFNRMISQIEKAFGERKRSEDQLRESEQRLRRFVADAGHELRTPLTSVRGYSELYRQGGLADPEQLDRAMGRIEENSYRMALLVEDLLLLARLDRDRTLERRPVDLVTVASDAVSDARAVEPSRPVSFEADDVVRVLGDEPRLRQVAGNLLTNARVHTLPDTPVRVRVSRSDDHAVLEVSDDGPGMRPDVKERVFERFYRADTSRSRAHGGAGLGLSIVAAIVDAHGGTVSVESRWGAGSTFRVELPLLVDGGDSNGSHADVEAPAAAPELPVADSTPELPVGGATPQLPVGSKPE